MQGPSPAGATIPQVALAWLLARSPPILPIAATTNSTSTYRE
jgi:aryl-alcohol dehydrogenase-like predicted oxidoreductase